LHRQDSSAPGFSTALGVLSAGFVLIGNVPSTDGSGTCVGNFDNVGQGSLTIVDHTGTSTLRLADPVLLDGPWDLTVFDKVTSALVFVSNVKSGTVTGLDVAIGAPFPGVTMTQIASGYPSRCDSAAFVVGPTGLAYDPATDVLYVASTDDNAIFTVADAGTRTTDGAKGTLLVQSNTFFHGPLGLVRASNGDLVSAQGDAVNPVKSNVNDAINTLEVWIF
jgi:DNA-binding beta-propeller fold protein YncE